MDIEPIEKPLTYQSKDISKLLMPLLMTEDIVDTAIITLSYVCLLCSGSLSSFFNTEIYTFILITAERANNWKFT